MTDNTPRPQAVVVDKDTAQALKQMAEKSKLSPSDIVRAGMTILSYAMGRKVRIQDDKRTVEIDSLEKYEKIVRLEDK